MKLSLKGFRSNAIREIDNIKESIEHLKEECIDKKEFLQEVEDSFNFPMIESSINTMFDIIVAICQERVTIEETKKFLFSSVDVHSIKQEGDFIKFDEVKS